MGVAVYFEFESHVDLLKSKTLVEIEGLWCAFCGTDPYESWYWDAPVVEKHFFKKNLYKYSGSVKLPPDDSAYMFVQKIFDILSDLRNSVRCERWSVRVDDADVPWDFRYMRFGGPNPYH